MRGSILLCLASLSAPCAAQVRTVVPSMEANAGEVEVVFLNEGAEAVSFAPPEEVSAARTGEAGPLILVATDRRPLEIAGKGFAKLTYAQSAPRSAAAAGSGVQTSGGGAKSLPGDSGGAASRGLLSNLEAYDPMYIIYGGAPDRVKLQLSLGVPLVQFGNAGRLQFAYTQTMLWATEQQSGPFTATTYSPKLFYAVPLRLSGHALDVAVGIAHDSTGEGRPRRRDPNRSRDVNRLFARISTQAELGGGWSLKVAPSGYVYILSEGLGADNISEFWGYAAADVAIEQERGFKLSAALRGNPGTGRGAAEINASYPLSRFWRGLPQLFAFGQLFTGYGESLVDYGVERTRLRFGIAFAR